MRAQVKVKICGITSLKDALLALECGADAIGFVFYEKSPRYVRKKVVKDICSHLPPFIHRVGVFVNETVHKINHIADYCGLDVIQLHGDESPSFCKSVRKKYFRFIKAIRMKDFYSLKSLSRYQGLVSGFLLDTYRENQWGGTGESFNWKLAIQAKKYGSIILAGGLNSRNVKEVLQKVKPYGIDVSSGVETLPGQKDPRKVKAFLKVVRGFS